MAIEIIDEKDYAITLAQLNNIKAKLLIYLENVKTNIIEPYRNHVKKLSAKINKYFWGRIVILLIMGAITVVANLVNFDLVTLLGTLGLDTLGVGLNFSELKEIVSKKFKVSNNLEKAINIIDRQVIKFYSVKLEEISKVEPKLTSMYTVLDRLFDLDICEDNFNNQVKEIVDELSGIAARPLSKF